ncbi:DUF6924 domain-containing protein [Streptomyces sp. NPDC090021]|uniref:DUF6924 domain-containing protein n=1 Tax=Streptomyces sp. NPDC090021 TaxID=3365919 RepID=UPI0038229169
MGGLVPAGRRREGPRRAPGPRAREDRGARGDARRERSLSAAGAGTRTGPGPRACCAPASPVRGTTAPGAGTAAVAPAHAGPADETAAKKPGTGLRTARRMPYGIHEMNANLMIANLDFGDFADVAREDPEGVFRGFAG